MIAADHRTSTRREPMAWMKPLLDAFARIWAWWRDLVYVLKPCRFSVFVVVFGGALLLAVPQGREMTVRLAADGWMHEVWFCAAVAAWAFQSWYWARFILDATFGTDRDKLTAAVSRRPARIRFLVDHLPRVIAFIAYAVAGAAALLTGNVVVAVVLLALGIAFYFALVRRRDLTGTVARLLGGAAGRWLERSPAGERSYTGLAPLSKAVFWISFASSALWFGWACVDPVGMGWAIGASGAAFIGFASIVPVGSMAVYAARSGGVTRVADEGDRVNDPRVGYPVVTLFIAAALVFSLWVDNHGVRAIDGAAPHQPVAPASAVESWFQASGQAGSGKPVDVVVVATAGGGIRAAYWTATVLGALQDCAPLFRKKLLAISGVSGGSLGATTFVTLLAQDAPKGAPAVCPAAAEAASWVPGPYESAGQKVLSQDFLAPAVSALLFPDLMQRFVPVSVLPDRAAALEKGWEQAWQRAGYDPRIWSERSFDDLWSGTPLPALLLNGTSVETGKRIITSNLKIDPAVFRDSLDFFDLFGPAGQAIRPSTAAHNSARFTYVSPAGRVNRDARVVDGGYHENFGAKTAGELLAAAMAQIGAANVRPIVVLISNDPNIRSGEMPATSVPAPCPTCRDKPAKGIAVGSEVLSPLWTLLNTRDAHGTRAAYDLHDVAAVNHGLFFHFRLCDDRQAPDPALGWVLSKESEASMQRLLRSTANCGNRQQFDELIKALAGPAAR
jgi:hypothetical protein